MATANFQMDAGNALGFSYQQFVSTVRALALSEPKTYFEMRRDVLEAVRTQAVANIYNSLFMVLTKGTDASGNVFKNKVGDDMAFGQKPYIPSYPTQKVNDFAMAVASDMADHINRAVDIILPDNFEQLASNNLRLTGMAKSINVPPATAAGAPAI